jgi:hypothetical protein
MRLASSRWSAPAGMTGSEPDRRRMSGNTPFPLAGEMEDDDHRGVQIGGQATDELDEWLNAAC